MNEKEIDCAVAYEPQEDESMCGEPCNPFRACDNCAEYWQRMRANGYWDDTKGWTEKGWREITK